MSNTEQTINKPPRMRGPMGGGPHGGHGPSVRKAPTTEPRRV